MELYIIRHGESESDLTNVFGGNFDDNLTEKGVEQAQRLAERLQNEGVEVIFSSPLKRAAQAAEIVASYLNIEVVYVDGLKERNYGKLGGMSKDENLIKELFPEYAKIPIPERIFACPPEGETQLEHYRRVVPAVEKVLTSCHDRYQKAAIMSHGGTNNILIAYLLGIHDFFYSRFPMGDTAITKLYQRFPSIWAMEYFNDMKHLA